MFRKFRAAVCAMAVVGGISLAAAPHASAATIEVTTAADAGAGSFRQAVLDAVDGDTITFAAAINGQTIDLASELIIDVNITVEGNGTANTIIEPHVNNMLIVDADVTMRGIQLSGGDDEGTLVRTVQGTTTAVFENMLITGNVGDGIDGEQNGGDLAITVRNSTISDNTTSGIELTGGGDGSLTLTVEDSTISGNGHDGIEVSNAAQVTVTRSTLSGNGDDGLVGRDEGTTMTATSSTFSGNADDGVDVEDGADLSLVNSTLSGNLDSGIDANALAGSVTVVNSTIVNNITHGIEINGSGTTATATNSIVHGNDVSDCLGTITSGGGNIAGDASCNLTGTADQPSTDPLLGALADNGGTTQTHLPQAGSPAIDTALAEPCPATDQRGQARPQDGDNNGSSVCDIGAVEVAALAVTTTTATPTTVAPTTTAAPTTLAPTTTILAELPPTGGDAASTQVWVSIGLLAGGLALVAASRRRASNP